MRGLGWLSVVGVVFSGQAMAACSVVTTLPVLVLFLALQRHYLDGLLAGSVKG